MEKYRSGFVSIIGCPNVGKSTLLNALIGQKIAIVTDRAQTTRNKITGVLTREGYQIIFLDTPGVTKPNSKLGDYMQKVTFDACNEVEAILFVADALQGVRERDGQLMDKLRKAKAPVVALVNKADAAREAQLAEACETLAERKQFASILTASAKTGEGIEELKAAIVAGIDTGESVYVTNERHIRALEQALTSLRQAKDALPISGLDCASMDIRDALTHLGEITGRDVDAAVIDRIFERFCVGK